MSDNSNDMERSTGRGKKGRLSFFVCVVGGIVMGAIFGNVGVGLAAAILLWLIGALFEKDGASDRQDS